LVWVQPPPSAESPAPEAHVTAAASIGERAIRIGSSEGQGGFRPVPGQAVVLTWVGGESLAVHLFGHPSGSEFPWEKWDWLWDGNLQWEWYNEVEKVEGAEVTLKKPLRLDIGSGWVVKLRPWTKCVEEVGIENLTIHVPVHRRPGHLRDPGYNGIFLENARNCWVRNVVIENGDNGVILENASNNTITSLRTTGAPCHHATSWRAFSHDNLMTNFRIENQPHHGIGSQDMASGNVWSDGVMEHGTLDLHCGMPFDSIRTNIAIVSCDGGGGGGGDAGPVCGRRIATWNVRVKSAGKQAGVALGSPEQYPLGAIVGLQGLSVPGNTKLWHMIAGDKGTVTVQEAAPPDLYLAQRKLRLSP
jgi:parallel beta-helix repeat protein